MFSLTQEEKKVILFLACLAIIGLGINFAIKRYAKATLITGLYQNIGKINLNTADKELLKGLPGIGEKLAQRILEYRQEHSGFTAIEQLRDIKGITDYRFQKIKDNIAL